MQKHAVLELARKVTGKQIGNSLPSIMSNSNIHSTKFKVCCGSPELAAEVAKQAKQLPDFQSSSVDTHWDAAIVYFNTTEAEKQHRKQYWDNYRAEAKAKKALANA